MGIEVKALRLVGVGYEADYGNMMFRNLEFLLWLLRDLESYREQINFVWRSVSVKLSPSLWVHKNTPGGEVELILIRSDPLWETQSHWPGSEPRV